MKPEETVDYSTKALWHAIARMYSAQGAPHSLTTTMGFVLLNIDQELGTPATKIAPLLGLEAHSLTRILRSMEEKKLIYRQSDPGDKRSVRIFLTTDGLEKKELARQTVRQFNQAVRERVPPEQLRTFFDVLDLIRQLIESKAIF